jgi:hypothetical protein
MRVYRALRSSILTVVLTGAIALVPTIAMAQQPPVPTGLVAVITNDPSGPLDLKPFRNRTISGIAFQINWNDISLSAPTHVKQVTQVPGEPPVIKYVLVPGKTDWTRLDELFAEAQKHNKWVQLLVYPGFDTPAWALVGVQTDQFQISYGEGATDFATLPMPWDPVYLANWFYFLEQLSERYGNLPAFRMIASGGPTSESDEFTEPPGDPTLPSSDPESVMGVALQWIKDGYTSTKYINAWQQTFEEYVADFPNQYISLSWGYGLEINANGQICKAQPPLTVQAILDEANNTLGDQFVLQASDLTGFQGTTPGSADSVPVQGVMSYIGVAAATGFQLATNCQHNAAGMGASDNPPTPPSALTNCIENGTQLFTLPSGLEEHSDYIEIYSPDIDAAEDKTLYDGPEMKAVLEWAKTLFPPPPPEP